MLGTICHLCRNILIIVLLILILPAHFIIGGSSDDLMVYMVNDYALEIPMMLYDPDYGITVRLPAEARGGYFRFSTDGQLAFSAIDADNVEVYVLDTLLPRNRPINISQNPLADDYPLAWSFDGRSLAFYSDQRDGAKLIYVWNGETIIDVTPHDLEDTVQTYRAAWSADGRLALYAEYIFTGAGDLNEVYLWDGNTTTNLSQNPTGYDYDPVWNTDGSLAFLSERDGTLGIWVWDGVSVKDGSPGADSFTYASPELSTQSLPVWTNDGRLAITATSVRDSGNTQIYIWDGQTVIDLSQNPNFANAKPIWNADGRWAFATVNSQWRLFVRDAENHSLLTIEGALPGGWSSNGYLAFCQQTQMGWFLSIWDGQSITHIAQEGQGWVIWAQWQGSSQFGCFAG